MQDENKIFVTFNRAWKLLCVIISHWLIVLKHKMPIQILHKSRWIGLVSVVHLWGVVRTGIPISGGYVKIVEL